MQLSRRIRENRPTIVLVVLVSLSLVSLASGTRGNIISNAVATAGSVIAYPFLRTFDAIGGGVNYAVGFVVAYDSSRKEATELREQVNKLVPRIADHDAIYQENQRLKGLLGFIESQPRLDLTAAKTVALSQDPIAAAKISSSAGVLVVNRGSIHGIEPAMCAMTKDGVAGIVIDVRPTLSYVATLHSDRCQIGAMIGRDKRVRATVHGSGSDFSHICRLEHIDTKDVVRVGDEVLTAGSGIFPAEYPIGTIVEVENSGSLFQVAYMEPYADPYSVDEIFLVKRAQPTLMEMSGQDPAANQPVVPEPEPLDMASRPKRNDDKAAFALPDTRSIQERYAP
ncbi:MAG TPA: rod shape-determining protein MreC [Candidatus Hydrogenedentes bacterium]|nr:rod shape-determining protein MreC [Candidatus Hydrogenedentota bacterium]